MPGHWEGDLLSGANNTHIATLVERHTRFAMLLKVPSKDTATVVAALGKHLRKTASRVAPLLDLGSRHVGGDGEALVVSHLLETTAYHSLKR